MRVLCQTCATEFFFFGGDFCFPWLCMGGFENKLIMLGVSICYGSAKRQLVPLLM